MKIKGWIGMGRERAALERSFCGGGDKVVCVRLWRLDVPKFNCGVDASVELLEH